ncbi:hypothetical protein KC573_04035, partial [candidate division WWE3 bacterium]|nr:hypothetical protein [candidate division WWE3 bacterium]
FMPIIVVGVLAIIIIGGGLWYLFNNNMTDPENNDITPTATPTESPVASPTYIPTPTVDVQNIVTYQNDNLGDFSFDYDADKWTISEKDFGQASNNNFPDCDSDCLGVDLTNNDIMFHMVFNISYEDNAGWACTDNPQFVELGNGWFRILDNSGYYYAYSSNENNPLGIKLDKTTSTGDCMRYQNEDNLASMQAAKGDDWSCSPNTTYSLCDGGQGPFVEMNSPYAAGPSNDGVPIQLMKPTIVGNPSETVLLEIDKIVNSITF